MVITDGIMQVVLLNGISKNKKGIESRKVSVRIMATYISERELRLKERVKNKEESINRNDLPVHL